jgi:hypothetical protein
MTHQAAHVVAVIGIAQQPVINVRCTVIGFGCCDKAIPDHLNRVINVRERISKHQGGMNPLKGVLEDGAHKWSLDRQHNLIRPWQMNDIGISWPSGARLDATKNAVKSKNEKKKRPTYLNEHLL